MFKLKRKVEVTTELKEWYDGIIQRRMDYTPASYKLARSIKQMIANTKKKQSGMLTLL
jgi:hypothetical protein